MGPRKRLIGSLYIQFFLAGLLLASSWCICSSSWRHFSSSWGHLGDPWHILGTLGDTFDILCLILAHLGMHLAHLGMIISISQCKYAYAFSEKLENTWFYWVQGTEISKITWFSQENWSNKLGFLKKIGQNLTFTLSF